MELLVKDTFHNHIHLTTGNSLNVLHVFIYIVNTTHFLTNRHLLNLRSICNIGLIYLNGIDKFFIAVIFHGSWYRVKFQFHFGKEHAVIINVSRPYKRKKIKWRRKK